MLFLCIVFLVVNSFVNFFFFFFKQKTAYEMRMSDWSSDVCSSDLVPGRVTDAPEQKKGGWFQRLKAGLTRSSSKLGEGITGIFTKRKLDDQALEELEELLITADLGVTTAARLTANLAKTRFHKEVDPREVREALAEDIAKVLEPVAQPLALDAAQKPAVVLVVGVNGSGKTTTIGKLATHWRREGLKVRLAAGDTFRAAAIEQLKIWGERAGCPVVAGNQGADAAGLAYSAVEQAKAAGDDVLLIDTAGRLHNKAELMAELPQTARVIKKEEPTAPDRKSTRLNSSH